MTTKKQIPTEQENQILGLLNKVQNMSDDEFKKVLSMGAGFHNYSLFNKIIISVQGGSQVAGYKAWQAKYNRQVKKGAKAIKILAPMMSYQIKVGDTWEYTTWKKHKNHKGMKKSFPTGYTTVNVFDIKDTEGDALPEVMTKKSDISYDQVLQAAEKLGYKVESKPMEYNLGGYINKDKEIFVNSNRQESANVGTLIHELAHGELGHVDTDNDHSYELCEQQAETVTYLVCQELGVERNSVFYLKSWKLSEDIMKDFQQITSVASKISRAIKGNAMRFITE